MSDDQRWQAPGASPAVPPVVPPIHQPAPPPAQQPAPPAIQPMPGYAPNFGPGMVAAPGTGGWTPPPKPGLVPLRPMTLGTILSASFQTLRRNPRPTLGPALIISLITTGLQTVAQATLLSGYASSLTSSSLAGVGSFYSQLLGSSIVPLLLGVLGTAILQGIVALEVARATLGDKQKLSGLLRQLKGRLLALVGWGFLLTFASAAAGVLLVVIVALLASLGNAAIVFSVLVAVLGGLAYLAALIWVGTKLIFVPSLVVVERLRLVDAFRRSWWLTTGYFWRTLGIQALVNIMIAIGISIVTTPVSLIFTFGGTLLNPNSTAADFTAGLLASTIAVGVVTAIVGSVGDVVQVATTALMYIDVRMRKEGLDLELARYVEARAAGTTSLPDPYQPHPRPAGASVS